MPKKQRRVPAPLAARQGAAVCGLALMGYFVCLGLVELLAGFFPNLLSLGPESGWQAAARILFWNALPPAAFLPAGLWAVRVLRPGMGRLRPGVLPTSLGPPRLRQGSSQLRWTLSGFAKSPPRLGLRRPRTGLPRGFAPLFLGLSMLASTAGSLLGRALGLRLGQTGLPEGGAPLAAGFLALCLLPALAEEVFFRGILRAALRPFGPGAAVLGTALLFSLSHGSLPQCLTALASGLALGLCAEWCGSVWPGAALHLCNNLLAFCAAWLSLYADPAAAGLFSAAAALGLLFWLAAQWLPGARRPSDKPRHSWTLPRARQGEPGIAALFADPAFRLTLAGLGLLALWRCLQ